MSINFDQMSSVELGKLFPIELSEYKDTWQDIYKAESQRIKDAIGEENIVRISHIGSTAVEGIQAAKPIIDILIEINVDSDLTDMENRMKNIGYSPSQQPNKPAPGLSFYKGYTSSGFEGEVFNVQVRYPGDWDELYFRDYLKNHYTVAEAYSNLKKKLISLFKHNRDEYTEAKTEYIENINKLARQEYGTKYDINHPEGEKDEN